MKKIILIIFVFCLGISKSDDYHFGILPILKFSIEMGQSNTGLGTSFSYGILIATSNSNAWGDAPNHGIYWYKTLSLKNFQNHKISYGLMTGMLPITNIKLGIKKIRIDENEYIGYELQPSVIILSSSISIYKKNKSKENLYGLGLGLGIF